MTEKITVAIAIAASILALGGTGTIVLAKPLVAASAGESVRATGADKATRTSEPASHLSALAASMPTGWQAIPNARLRDVMPEKGETEWGVVGPRSVLTTWNNVAFDGQNVYAHGGGHADYGGNEVYRLSLTTLRWERLTEPAPYPPRVLVSPDGTPTARNSQARCPAPLSGPPSSHTYDGKFVVDGRLWVSTTSIAFCPSGVGEIYYGGLWAFDLRTKEWSRTDAPIGGFWLTAVLPDGNVFIANQSLDAIYDPRRLVLVQQQGGYGNEADGSAVYDAKRNRVWITNRAGTAFIPLTADFKLGGRRTRVLPKNPGQPRHVDGIIFSSSSVIDPASGRLLFWSGGRDVVAYTPETDRWERYVFPTGPNSRVPLYDRLFPLPGHDGVFIAVSNNIDENVWLLKVPSEPGAEIRLDPGR